MFNLIANHPKVTPPLQTQGSWVAPFNRPLSDSHTEGVVESPMLLTTDTISRFIETFMINLKANEDEPKSEPKPSWLAFSFACQSIRFIK